MEYKTVIHTGCGFPDTIHVIQEQFDEKVNAQIQEGWKPQGGVSISKMKSTLGGVEESITFAIGMIKE